MRVCTHTHLARNALSLAVGLLLDALLLVEPRLLLARLTLQLGNARLLLVDQLLLRLLFFDL